MTTKLPAPAPYMRFQTSGALYAADRNGVVAAPAIGDVIEVNAMN